MFIVDITYFPLFGYVTREPYRIKSSILISLQEQKHVAQWPTTIADQKSVASWGGILGESIDPNNGY